MATLDGNLFYDMKNDTSDLAAGLMAAVPVQAGAPDGVCVSERVCVCGGGGGGGRGPQ